ncbi:MAG TPA: CRISPR-associated endonuclease Cas2 [Clostridiaceae bacterium]|nr:CRISPR-associated endonuclease Cas2 [Clostridiaceae bacterium]
MLIISYDISDDKVRTRFSKFLSKHGYRLQYSVFRIKNSDRHLEIIIQQIKDHFMKKFKESDSIMIYPVDESKMLQFGYSNHEDEDMIIVV